MRSKNKVKQKKIIKILNITGLFLCGISFIMIINDFVTSSIIMMFFGILLTIPDYWKFYQEQAENKPKMSMFWFVKFASLILVCITLLFFFVYIVVSKN